ncbi:NADH dehydrogenase [ubiquinone] iron-sulfur protein 5-B-like [Teratosphaeria destructans]|uniref:NADH dehydrogenase [ubiquinone] iron-sulfur protein 5-B-like n=1 Tax=Teratosphaeria destructans TaxID=418781 RepID=A0A9W7SXU1_9PEZI|nr:NADH dehydrogenase [ubiquinone] iron-sulfur protein 5-B-like [Teratosphaeria destructans]
MQAAKIRSLQDAYRKREVETARDKAPNAGEIRSLGLLEREKDEQVGIKHGSLLPTFGSNVSK